MIILVLVLLLYDIHFGETCFCIKCKSYLDHRIHFFTTRLDDLPCFHDVSDSSKVACTSGCFSQFLVTFDSAQSMQDFRWISSTNLSIIRNCKKSSSKKLSYCKWNYQNPIHVIGCKFYCTSLMACNSNYKFSDFIENKRNRVVPTCISCEVGISSMECINGKEIPCFGNCYYLIHVDQDKQVIRRKGCLITKGKIKTKQDQYKSIDGEWQYKTCVAELYYMCNKEIQLNDSPMKTSTRYKIRKNICIRCIQTRLETDVISLCDKGIPSTMFNVERCNSACISYYVAYNKKVSMIRGCDGRQNLRTNFLKKAKLEQIETNNDTIGCWGCSRNFQPKSKSRRYLNAFFIHSDISYEECKLKCNVLGRTDCKVMTYYWTLNKCHIFKDESYIIDYEMLKEHRINLEFNKGKCQFHCYLTCESDTRSCNNIDVTSLKDIWSNTSFGMNINLHNANITQNYDIVKSEYDSMMKKKYMKRVDMSMLNGFERIPGQEVMRCVVEEKCFTKSIKGLPHVVIQLPKGVQSISEINSEPRKKEEFLKSNSKNLEKIHIEAEQLLELRDAPHKNILTGIKPNSIYTMKMTEVDDMIQARKEAMKREIKRLHYKSGIYNRVKYTMKNIWNYRKKNQMKQIRHEIMRGKKRSFLSKTAIGVSVFAGIIMYVGSREIYKVYLNKPHEVIQVVEIAPKKTVPKDVKGKNILIRTEDVIPLEKNINFKTIFYETTTMEPPFIKVERTTRKKRPAIKKETIKKANKTKNAKKKKNGFINSKDEKWDDKDNVNTDIYGYMVVNAVLLIVLAYSIISCIRSKNDPEDDDTDINSQM